MQMLSLVMTVIGPDRPGLVDDLSELVQRHGGNWLESRLCRLGGEFAGIARVSVPSDQTAALEEALQALDKKGLQVVSRIESSSKAMENSRRVRLELVGSDQPGIVRRISSVLARHQVNIEDFKTEVISAPMSGEPLFQAKALLQIPAECDPTVLRKDLEEITVDLMADMIFGRPG